MSAKQASTKRIIFGTDAELGNYVLVLNTAKRI